MGRWFILKKKKLQGGKTLEVFLPVCVDLLHHIRGIEGVWLPKFSWELPPVFSVRRSLDLRSSSSSSAAAGTFFEASSHFKFD